MNEQNIMENNEVLEAAEDVVTSGSGLGLKLAGGALILGGAIYGGIKLIRKIRTKKDDDAIIDGAEDENVEVVEVEEEKKNDKKKKN